MICFGVFVSNYRFNYLQIFATYSVKMCITCRLAGSSISYFSLVITAQRLLITASSRVGFKYNVLFTFFLVYSEFYCATENIFNILTVTFIIQLMKTKK